MDPKLKVLITGASGLLGRMTLSKALEENFNAIGLALTRVGGNLIKCDLTKPGEVESLIEEIQPNYIVHAAAERFPDRVENDYEKTRIFNVDCPRRLAAVAKKIGCKIFYISTDYVFDGQSPPYKENDIPNPLNKYGQTKHDGEIAVLEANQDACILRIPVLYGPVERLDESAVTCLLPSLLTKEPKSISHYEKRYPSHTKDIASSICDLIKAVEKDPSIKGLFHLGGKEELTKYEMMMIMAKVFKLSCDHIAADSRPSTGGALRPFDCQLDNSRLESLGIAHHTKFEDGIRECLEPWITVERHL